MKPGISVVIPAYNSEDSLPVLIRHLNSELDKIASRFEIIIIDDASTDQTWQRIKEHCDSFPWIRGIQLMKNSGQVNATLCGLKTARNDIVVTMDDDLQHPADQIPKLLSAMEKNPEIDCAFGIFKRKHHTFYRNIGSGIIHFINRKTFNIPEHSSFSSFRMMRKKLAKNITSRETSNPSLSVLIFGCTKNVLSLTVRHNSRAFGKSNYSFSKQLRLAFDNICTASMMPLRFVSATGFFFCIVSILLASYYFTKYLTGNIEVQGWTTIILLLILFSGIILLSLGIIGEYLVRVLREVNHAPPFLIRRKINMDQDFSHLEG